MIDPLRQLLIAIGDNLEYRSGPKGARAFVREPLYNLATSYRKYLESMPESDQKQGLLDQYNRHFLEKEKQLSVLYT
jgi:hypothetical protein